MLIVDPETELENRADYDQLFSQLKSDNNNATFQELCYSTILYLKYQIEKIEELQDENYETEMLDETMADKVSSIEEEIDDIGFFFRKHSLETIRKASSNYVIKEN